MYKKWPLPNDGPRSDLQQIALPALSGLTGYLEQRSTEKVNAFVSDL